jgi:hypothetical protein
MSKLQFTDVISAPIEATITNIEENMSDAVPARVAKVLDMYQELLEVVAGMTVLIAKYDQGTIGAASLESKVLSLQSAHGDIFGLHDSLDLDEEDDDEEEYTGPTLYVDDDFDDSTKDDGDIIELNPSYKLPSPHDLDMTIFTPTPRQLAMHE